MKFYNIIIKYRLYIGLVLVLGGIAINYTSSFWPAFPLNLIGVILMGVGLLGEYVGRIYAQVLGRPRYRISTILQSGPSAAGTRSSSAQRTDDAA